MSKPRRPGATTNDNPFTSYFVERQPVWQKKKEEQAQRRKEKKAAREAEMIKTRLEQELYDQQVLATEWHRYKRKEIDEHLAGPYPEQFAELRRVLKGLTIDDADVLIAYIRNAEWLKVASLSARHLVLFMVDQRIMQLREQNGLVPIDDSLPDDLLPPGDREEPSAYIAVRDLLGVYGAKG